jgi:predicted amidohydrolase YtcJ
MADDLTIRNGHILGHDGATAIRIEAGRITGIGTDAGLGTQGEVVDAQGGLVMPGFDDAHTHLLYGARQMRDADLFPHRTVETILAAIAAHAAATPERPWVRGRGWLYSPFPGGMPSRRLLDTVVPDRPAFLRCYDGHTAWVNSAALALAGIDRATPDPFNGVIVRDEDGEPTGALLEDAQVLVERILPVATEPEDRAGVREAVAAFHRLGLTAAQDAMAELAEFDFWRGPARDDVDLRFRASITMDHGQSFSEWCERLDAFERAAFPLRGGRRLDAGIIKGFVDGVIEARTAAMLAPYEGDTSTGLPAWEPDQLKAFVAEADRRGWQVELHAIGDRGVRMALDAYEHAARVNGPWTGDPLGRGAARGTVTRRHRVEHLETVDRADIPRFAQLGVVASMQPFHGDPSPEQIDVWAANIGPDRASRAWPWRSITDAGGRIAFGSDWPVVPFDPFIALNNAVNRQTTGGEPAGGWLPSERLTVEDALVAYTAGSAWAAFAEHRRGRLGLGLDADVIVLDRDLLAAGPSAIIGTSVRATVLGGRIVHRSEDVA